MYDDHDNPFGLVCEHSRFVTYAPTSTRRRTTTPPGHSQRSPGATPTTTPELSARKDTEQYLLVRSATPSPSRVSVWAAWGSAKASAHLPNARRGFALPHQAAGPRSIERFLAGLLAIAISGRRRPRPLDSGFLTLQEPACGRSSRRRRRRGVARVLVRTLQRERRDRDSDSQRHCHWPLRSQRLRKRPRSSWWVQAAASAS